MLQNYFRIAYRNLLRNKAFSLINIAGLSLGIACCTLLGLYLREELLYEKHFEAADRIYRITSTIRQGDGDAEILQRTSPPVAPTMLEEMPELESATRIVNPPEVEQHLIRKGENTFYEDRGFLVDSTFLDVFSFELREGDRTTALKGRSAVILSDELARKLFGDASALDETLIITSGFSVDTFRVTGVLKPLTKKSHVNADFYMTMNSEGWGDFILSMNTWSGQNFIFSYIRLKPGAVASDLIAKLPDFQERHGGEEMRMMKRKKELGLQPLTDVHLHSSHFAYGLDLDTNGSIYYVYVTGAVAAFILLIACINFMNLTTAKATQRAGEVGVRKTMGASQKELIAQFLGESFATILVALIVAAGLVQIALPLFNAATNKQLSLTSANIPFFVGILTITSLITGLLAGSYPAFFLSSFRPAQVLKQKSLLTGSSSWLRKGLVVVQFVIAITLIACSAIVQEQLTYIQQKDLGYAADYRLAIPLRTPEARSGYEIMKKSAEQLAGVKAVAATTSLPATPLLRDFSIYREGNDMQQAQHHFICNVDEGYFDMLNIPIIAGRSFDRSRDKSDTINNIIPVMVNRVSLQKLGIPLEDAIGARPRYTGRLQGSQDEQTLTFDIIGVVEDFHFASLHSSIDPIAFFLPDNTDSFLFMAIAVEPGSYAALKGQLEELWKKHIPNTPFESNLLTDEVAAQYEGDRQVFLVISFFTVIAICISCLGLYGLSVFVGERRLKEIGVRKVLGASTFSIVRMLSGEFILLVGIAVVIALPAGILFMESWLQNFAYQTSVNSATFIAAGAIAFLIAWTTVAFEAIRAANSNPVDSLRND